MNVDIYSRGVVAYEKRTCKKIELTHLGNFDRLCELYLRGNYTIFPYKLFQPTYAPAEKKTKAWIKLIKW